MNNVHHLVYGVSNSEQQLPANGLSLSAQGMLSVWHSGQSLNDGSRRVSGTEAA